MEWTIFILDDVVDEGGNAEVSNCDILTNKEPVLILTLPLKLLLANGQKFGQNAVTDLLHLFTLFFIAHFLVEHNGCD